MSEQVSELTSESNGYIYVCVCVYVGIEREGIADKARSCISVWPHATAATAVSFFYRCV